MVRFYDTWKDGTATVSFYNHVILREMGIKSMYDMSEQLETVVEINYPGMTARDIAHFDPESDGFMVYCATEEIAEVVNQELNEFIFCELGKYPE